LYVRVDSSVTTRTEREVEEGEGRVAKWSGMKPPTDLSRTANGVEHDGPTDSIPRFPHGSTCSKGSFGASNASLSGIIALESYVARHSDAPR
jgi:hypothetical protein